MWPHMTASSVPNGTSAYNSDQPVTDPALDLYSRMPVAEGIAKAIRSLPKNECFVIGLHGQWGDGKSTVLQFVRHALKDNPSITCVPFNPWRVSSDDALITEFFHEIASAGHIALKSRFDEAMKAIVEYARVLRPLGPLAKVAANLVAPGATLVVDGQAAVDAAAEWAEQFEQPTVEKQRATLQSKLRELDHRLVVIVDDIDRLSAEDVASLFRLIKACLDLPNVVYLLAFDRDMVAAALHGGIARGGNDAGHKYLEKIIQIPVVLPPAARRDLDRVCNGCIADLLATADVALSEQELLRWQWVYQNGISRRLRTPRQVGQYLNAVRFSLPLLNNEVNTVDLLLVEALRVCYPAVYDVVRINQDAFIGVPIGDAERQRGNTLQDELLDASRKKLSAGDAVAMDCLLETIFPRYHAPRRGLRLSYESTKPWTQQRLVCSPAYGPRYFAYAVGSSDVADTNINEIIDAATGAGSPSLPVLLAKQLEPLKQAVLILKLTDQCPRLRESAAFNLAIMLAAVSDRFDEPFSLQDVNHPGINAARLVVRLCHQVPAPATRLQVATTVLDRGQPWFAAAFMREADKSFPESSAEVPAFDVGTLSALRERFVIFYRKLEHYGLTFLDLQRRWKFEMLFSVARAGGREVFQSRFLERMGSQGDLAVRMLQLITQPIAGSNEVTPTPGTFTASDLETLALLIDVNQFADVVQGFVAERFKAHSGDDSAFSPEDRILVQFLRVHARPAGTP